MYNIRSKHIGISSKNNEFNHCRRKSKVYDIMMNNIMLKTGP